MAGKKWTEEEVTFIKNNHGKISAEEMAKRLDRTKKSVWHQFGKLGLSKEDTYLKVGDKHNKLTIKRIWQEDRYGQKISYALCDCDCGNEHTCKLTSIKSGHSQSCGCLRNEKASQRMSDYNIKYEPLPDGNYKGGFHYRLYRIWCGMKKRCYNKNETNYIYYGGKGVTVCQEWLDNFLKFEKWALDNGYSDDLSIDRINVDGNYEPDNCRWATRKEQANNTSRSVSINTMVTAFGETKSVIDWVKDDRCPIQSYETLRYRIDSGWQPEYAITRVSERARQ